MKKGWKIALTIGIILLIGGGVTYAMGFDKNYFERQENKKYNEEYTSPAKRNDSFVKFKSHNKHFSIDLPKDFEISEKFHEKGSDFFELFLAVKSDTETSKYGDWSDISVMYEVLEGDDLTSAIDILLDDNSFNGQHEVTNQNELTIYTGESHYDSDKKQNLDPKEHGTNVFFAMVIEDSSREAVQVHFSLGCHNDKNKCGIDEEHSRETFRKIVNSITFE